MGRAPSASTTVNRLAEQFDASILVAAAIQSQNRQDFTGAPLPSGRSVDSRAMSIETGGVSGAHALSRGAESALVPAHQRQAQILASARLRGRLREAGLAVVPNSGEGNLCLVHSMLQRAGVASEDVAPQALRVRAELAGRPDALGQALRAGQGLHADPQVFRPLADHIFGEGNVPPMLILTAGGHGMPLLYAPLGEEPATWPNDTAVFLESPGHFEAVANNSGRPLSTVLRQLQMAPHEPDNVRRAEWLRHTIQEARPMSVAAIGAGGATQAHQWTRGAQTRLTLLKSSDEMESDDEDLGPLRQARAMADAQGAVDDFLTALGQWDSYDLGLTRSGEHQLGISPWEGYQEALPRNHRGVVELAPLQANESAFQYVAELQIRQGRVLGLTLHTTGEGDIAVEFDHPWARPQLNRMPGRATLTHADDLDAFDEFAARERAPDLVRDLARFAAFLLDLRRHGMGMGWEEFRHTPAPQRDRYLRDAVADLHISRNVPAAVRRAIDPPEGSVTARATLAHPDDLAAFDEFASRDRAPGQAQDPVRFASFLRDLRQHGKGMGWEEFSNIPEGERERYLLDAVADGHLDDPVPETVRRAIEPGGISGAHSLSRGAESALIPADSQQAQILASAVLHGRLPEAGLTVVPNSGEGNLCLVHSMLQRAGLAAEDVAPQALRVQAELAGRPGALGQALRAGQGLHADPQVFRPLADHIFGEGNVPPMLILTAGGHGMPLLYTPLGEAPATWPNDTAVFLESPGHFEAVANNSGRPLSTVLRQLQMAPHEPDNVRRAAWLQHTIQEARSMSVAAIGAGGATQAHQWTRGAQTRLTVEGLGDEDLGPLRQAQAMAEAQGAVDDFLTALGRWDSYDLGLTPSGDQQLGISPWEGYQEALPRDHRGAVELLGLQAGESAFQYVAELQIRQGRMMGLTLHTMGEGDIEVEFDHPWARPQMNSMPGRATLTHADDLDAFDEFAARERAPGQVQDPARFADFLLDLRQRGMGMGWEEFRHTPATLRDRYLRDGVEDGHLNRSTPAAVRRAIDPQRTVQRKVSARASLTHLDDLAAFDLFASREHEPGTTQDLSRFANFLRDLRQSGMGMGFEEFSNIPEEERERYLLDAVADGLDRNVPAAVRRAIDPQRPAVRITARATLTHPDDLAAFDEFTSTERAPNDPSQFAAFLRDLRQRGMGMDWEEFPHIPEEERERYLRDAVAGSDLDRSVPATVRRAIDSHLEAQQAAERAAQRDADA